MDFITSAILGGALYDLVTYELKPTIRTVSKSVGKLINIDDTVAEAISNELEQHDLNKCESEEMLIALIEQSKPLQDILKSLNGQSGGGQQIIINNHGPGDAFVGDKIMGDKNV